jgi:hypothetical protein
MIEKQSNCCTVVGGEKKGKKSSGMVPAISNLPTRMAFAMWQPTTNTVPIKDLFATTTFVLVLT